MSVELSAPPFAGGCQCGAIRYRLTAVPTRANICHCGMRQKAGGAPFMAFTGVKPADFVLTRGTPARYASSDIAERGFCAACGAPLTYQMIGCNWISVTIGSLDDPANFAPSVQSGIEARLPWFATLAALPGQRTDDWLGPAKIANVGSRQHPDRET